MRRLGAVLAERKTLQPATTGAAFKSTATATMQSCAVRCEVSAVAEGALGEQAMADFKKQ